ncbi:MAG: type II toxin-antitoxin system VapC family toxin [Nocardioidaceae bacterium]|nr:type II toxin-antitoxin system VapC family toxin [Nocardioidaceae bacterium]
MAEAVADASALVDLLLGNELGGAVKRRIAGHALHAPAHLDAEVLSALGRLQRAGSIEHDDVETMLHELAAAPIQRHPVSGLLIGAWARRHQLRLADALYVELAMTRGLPLITTDRRLHPVPIAEILDE